MWSLLGVQMDSRRTPENSVVIWLFLWNPGGVHLESTWSMWSKVKYWDIYPATTVIFCIPPGHVLHFYMCVAYLSFVYIMQMLQQFRIFLRNLPGHQSYFFWAFCTSPGHVLNGVWVNVGGSMLFAFRIFTHQCIMQMLRKFCIVPGHLYGQFVSDVPHIPVTCIGFDMPVAYFYFRDLDANLFGHMLWMLQVFRIFPGHLPGQQGFFSGFSAHPQNMYYIWMCCWHILFWRFSCQFICAHALDAPGIPHFPRTLIWTPGLFFLGFAHIPGTCTAFLHVVGLLYFGYLVIKLYMYILQMLQKFCIFLGHLPGHGGLFFSGFPDTTSCRCSSFSWDIYPDTMVVFSGCCTSCRCPGNSAFSWDIYTGMGVVFFRVFQTLHHADTLVFLRTFTQTQGLFFFSGFPHSWSFWYHCSQAFLSLIPRYTRIWPIFSPIADRWFRLSMKLLIIWSK